MEYEENGQKVDPYDIDTLYDRNQEFCDIQSCLLKESDCTDDST